MSDRIIVAENLTLAYEKNKSIIRNSNLHIKSESFTFVTGPSGSGKSTFIKALHGQLPINIGNLSVCGIPMRSITRNKLTHLRRHIGVVFQDYQLIQEYKIEENIMLSLKINGYKNNVCISQTNKLLSHVKLTHQKGKYPYELSGGEQQRVAMARALAANPLLILADEPTGNLDEYSSDVIWKLLASANTQLKATVLVVTHHIPKNIGIDYKHYHIEDGILYEIS